MESDSLVRFIMDPKELTELKWNERFRYNCTNCGRTVEYVFQGKAKINRYSELLCDKCRTKRTLLTRYGSETYNNREQAKQTYSDKTGYDNPFQNPNIKEKRDDTMLEKYGVKYSYQSEELRKKAQNTCIDKYGKPEMFQYGSDEFNDSMIEKHGTKNYRNVEKRNSTNLDKYGIENPISSKEFIAISKASKEMRYGDENFNNREKAKQTNLDKYGEEFAYSYGSNSFRDLMIERYGVPSYLMTDEYINYLIDKFGVGHAYSRFLYNGFRFDSAPELALWIYAKDHNESITREPVTFGFEYEGKQFHVTPDFMYNGNLIELKGSQFFKDKDPTKEMINPYDHSKDGLYEAKRKCELTHGVLIWSDDDYRPYMEYIASTYGETYLSRYKLHGNFTEAMFAKTGNSVSYFDADKTKEYQLNDELGLTPFDIKN